MLARAIIKPRLRFRQRLSNRLVHETNYTRNGSTSSSSSTTKTKPPSGDRSNLQSGPAGNSNLNGDSKIYRYLPDALTLARGCLGGVCVLLVGHVFINYFYALSPCEGISMLPWFNSFGDWVVISKYYRRGRGVQVGDVVSFKHPVDGEAKAIKRVLGMPGDFVCRDTPGVGDRIVQVPQGHCWVVGDNVAHSRDSRIFGPLPLALVRGKVIWRIATEPNYSWPEAVESTLKVATEDYDID